MADNRINSAQEDNKSRALEKISEHPLMPGPYYPYGEDEVHLRDYLQILLRRKWIVITFLLTVFTTVTIGTFMIKPQYKSTVTIKIDSTHLRNEDDRVLEAIDEAIAVAEGAGCLLQVAHLKAQGPRNWSKMGEALTRLDRAEKDAVDAAFDIYPYVAYQTGLSNLFPLWSRDGATDAFLARLHAPATAHRVRALTLAKVELIGGWDNVLISGVANAADSAAAGQRLGALAAVRGADPYQLAGDLLRRSRGNVGMVGFAMSEENVERGLAHPKSMICSDGSAVATEGPARRGHPHPRSLGTFPRVLGHYVRDRKVLTLEAAIHKMTARSAARLRIRDRGTIAPGMAADLVAFDPDAVADRATFADPFQYPSGIALVLVNGAVVYRGGARTGARPGGPVRPR